MYYSYSMQLSARDLLCPDHLQGKTIDPVVTISQLFKFQEPGVNFHYLTNNNRCDQRAGIFTDISVVRNI